MECYYFWIENSIALSFFLSFFLKESHMTSVNGRVVIALKFLCLVSRFPMVFVQFVKDHNSFKAYNLFDRCVFHTSSAPDLLIRTQGPKNKA